MLINTISTERSAQLTQKKYLLAALTTLTGKQDPAVTAQILLRLKTIEELESEHHNFCPLKKPPYGAIYNEIHKLREKYKTATPAQKARSKRIAENLLKAMNTKPATELEFAVQEAGDKQIQADAQAALL